MSIPGLDAWLDTAQGHYVGAWEAAIVEHAIADVFGFNALQLGLPQWDLLHASRIPLRQKAGESGAVDVLCELTAMPFASLSTDLVILPHVLEFSSDAHQILREVERILIPEGHLIILGFNPLSLWGVRNRFDRSGSFPWQGNYLSLTRLKDWLKLLSFEVDRSVSGCHVPPCDQETWLKRWHFMETAGARWPGLPGGVYLLHAIKRVNSMRLITPNWRKKPVPAKALRPIAQKDCHDR